MSVNTMIHLTPVGSVGAVVCTFCRLSSEVRGIELRVLKKMSSRRCTSRYCTLIGRLSVGGLIFAKEMSVMRCVEGLSFAVLADVSRNRPLSILRSFTTEHPYMAASMKYYQRLLGKGRKSSFKYTNCYIPPVCESKLTFTVRGVYRSEEEQVEVKGDKRTEAGTCCERRHVVDRCEGLCERIRRTCNES